MRILSRIISGTIIFSLLFTAVSCVGNGTVARIEFSGTAATQHQRKIEYDFSDLYEQADTLDISLGAPPMLNNIGKKYNKDILLSAFDMSNVKREKMENTSVRAYRYIDGQKRLITHDDGFISFYNTALYGVAPTLSDEEYKSIAEAVIEKLGLDLSELSPSEMVDANGARLLSYNRTINGIKVVGNSGLHFYFEGDGLSIFKQQCSTYSGETSFEPIGVKAALDKLLTADSSQNFGRDETTARIKTVLVDSVQMVYWDSFKSQVYQTHIQPVYLFHGTATDSDGVETVFTGYVRAVSDDLTASFGISLSNDEYFTGA